MRRASKKRHPLLPVFKIDGGVLPSHRSDNKHPFLVLTYPPRQQDKNLSKVQNAKESGFSQAAPYRKRYHHKSQDGQIILQISPEKLESSSLW